MRVNSDRNPVWPRSIEVTMTVNISLPPASSRARSGNRRRLIRPSLSPNPRNRPRIESLMLIIDFCSVQRALSRARSSCADTDFQCTGRQPSHLW
ncbi:MAG: hypothetical protein ABJH07_00075 [Sedimentitalea sp.]|uniref:hypothetical protein n=1 Tax=Sedimentitalea sp. TaxID=2048915 RepID=UPI003264265B